jgi:hypothetical protein
LEVLIHPEMKTYLFGALLGITIMHSQRVSYSCHGFPGGDAGKQVVLCPTPSGGGTELGLKSGVQGAVGQTTISFYGVLAVGMDCNVEKKKNGRKARCHGRWMASERRAVGKVCSSTEGSVDPVKSSSLVLDLSLGRKIVSLDHNLALGSGGPMQDD